MCVFTRVVDKMSVLPCVQSFQSYTRKNVQLVTNLQQTCSKLVGTSLLQDLFALFIPSLLRSCYKSAADLLQAWWTQQPCLHKFVPTTCYHAASQQLVNMLWVTNLVQLDKITALLELVDKLVTSLLRASCEHNFTRKNAQLVTNLQTNCYKSVHKLSRRCLRTACSQLLEQVVNSCWTSCNKLDDIIWLLRSLF